VGVRPTSSSTPDPKLIAQVMKTLEATSEMPIGLRKFKRKDGTTLEVETSIGRTKIETRQRPSNASKPSFLAKPYVPDELAARVREVLDQGSVRP